MLSKASATLLKDPGSHLVTGLGKVCQLFADSREVGFDELVVAEGEQPEAVLDAEVLENHLFDAFRGMRKPGSLEREHALFIATTKKRPHPQIVHSNHLIRADLQAFFADKRSIFNLPLNRVRLIDLGF